jgi:hypothetical protein
MGIHIPPVLVLIVCKVAIAGAPDQNAGLTGVENLEWATEHAMMLCRRNEVPLYDPVEGMKLSAGDDPALPLNSDFTIPTQCARAGIPLASTWDQEHRNSPWRVWRVGCPAPIVDTRTGTLIGYKLPECSHQDTVVCETDSAI